ncbi:sugar ABC transporter permease [Arthrobacter sp. I2-34]|uniref:Xylose transport system permease protein XylH n=1 Tax=Arthrobacter hankyongi TaxID=2904801 RepID=A0ABS9L1P4_9MICC|nr:sugar ABC transporter permease [Arthrobacter hankyongi]MCG2620567.1 sugar ABC transporter permease [Arthrobacter hankyongi]
MTVNPASTDVPVATDLQDERLIRTEGFRGAVKVGINRVRGGDLGVLPIVVGLLIIWTIFQLLNPFFLSSANLVNLLLESAAVGVISLGIVCVLLVGEIDLSVGSVSGLSAAIVGVTFVKQGWPIALAILAAIAVAAVIGLIYSFVYNKFGVPSFVITLAGLLGFLGLQLWVLGVEGTINLPFDAFLVWFGQQAFVPAWLSYVLAALGVAGFFLSQLSLSRQRVKAGLSGRPMGLVIGQTVILAVVLFFSFWYLNRARGVGWMFVFFAVLVLIMHYAFTRTRWGRSVYAVGGNREAARRAGIGVTGIYTSIFVLCSSFAAIGGILAAGRLAAAAQSSGTGDVNLNAIAAAVIGGTSLFGGRGSAFSALLGILVIQSITSGLTLLNLESSFRYMITGLVLLLAVILDAVSRKSRTSHGRA